MRIKAFAPILVFFAFVLSAAGPAAAYDGLGGSVAITSRGTVPSTSGPLLDNFDEARTLNLWGGLTGTFSEFDPMTPTSICTASYTDAAGVVFGGSGHSLRLDYNVYGNNTFSGYYTDLAGADLSDFTHLTFWVRGASGGEYFKIELKNNASDANRKIARVYVSDFLDGGVTTAWQQVAIPFHNFANIDDWTSMSELTIVLENGQSAINGSPRSGTIYIDDIIFTKTAVAAVRIDHFGDKIKLCSLGGGMGEMDGPGGTSQISFYSFAGGYHDYPNGLYGYYSVTDGSWSGMYIKFSGGASGDTAMPHDFSEFNFLTFQIKALLASNNPKTIKVELQDASGTRVYWITDIMPDWTRYSIPLTSFSGLDKTTIKQLNFVYDGTVILAAGGNIEGGIFMDEIQFE
jgi:hypothetical protein